MGGLGISTDDIKNAVESQNLQAAAGLVGAEGGNDFLQFKIDIKGRLKTAEEFENIIVKNDDDGNIVRLKDIARIELGADSYGASCSFNGKSSVGLGVFKTTDANALNTVNAVKKELERLSRHFPEGVSWEIAYDPTKFIEISMREIVVTLISVLVLVVLITYLFLQDWRATLIPAVAIPISLVGTFTAMYALGYSINLLTMFGLILVIGSLVDDAIVVVENCQSVMLRERVDAKTASIKSMKQITGAVIVTTLVTIACYVPLAFYGGMVGEIYTQFAVTMCIALSISTLVALTLSPALCAILLKKEELSEKLFFKPVNFAINGGRNLYTKIVGFLAARLFLTFAIFCAVVGLSYFLFGYLKSSFIPMEDKGTIMCDIELPPGASLSRTEAATKKFENMIKKIGGVKNYMTVNGRGMVSGSGENVAMTIVELDDWDKRTTEELSLSSIVRRIQEGAKSIPEANIMAFTPPAIWNIAGGAEMVQNIFNGNRNMNAIEQAVSELRSARSQISEYEQKAYAELTTAHLNLEKSKKQYEVALAAEKVAKENLDLVTERFNVGKVSALERTDAQVSYTSAQADAVSAKYDWQDALATIAYLTGGDVKSEN